MRNPNRMMASPTPVGCDLCLRTATEIEQEQTLPYGGPRTIDVGPDGALEFRPATDAGPSGLELISSGIAYPICAPGEHAFMCGCGDDADHPYTGHSPIAVGCYACQRPMSVIEQEQALPHGGSDS